MNTGWNRTVESPAELIMSYALRKYNFIQTHIKDMINLVNLKLIVKIEKPRETQRERLETAFS